MPNMDLDLTPTYSTSTRSPDDTEIDTPPHKTQPIKILSFTNGALTNHYRPPPPPETAVVAYKECMKNHAANIGGHAVDGCGEFMPSPASKETEPTSLKCAACGCHRNFHRREPESPTAAVNPQFLDFRHPPFHKRFSLSPSPPPPLAALAYAPPHFLLTGFVAAEQHQEPLTPMAENPVGRKRFRTKFSQEQKVKMQSFSEKLGWKMQKCDEEAVKEFCHEIGVSRGVLKVWMHNNKNTLAKKEINGGGNLVNGRSISFENLNSGGGKSEEEKIDNGGHFQNESENGVHIHGSCSS